MKTNRIEEIAESFINGNISWVKAQLANKRKTTAAVAEWLSYNAPSELASFLRIMKG